MHINHFLLSKMKERRYIFHLTNTWLLHTEFIPDTKMNTVCEVCLNRTQTLTFDAANL